ncbi:MAG: serine hydrolase domain-containing protein [Alphaproteobacteria bacterium]|nr:serine hydrolase domain-containing protein [Alphaproteobacteria bacterium]
MVRFILRIMGALVGLAVLFVGGLAALYFSYRLPIPDFAQARHVDTHFAKAVDTDVASRLRKRLAELRRTGHYPSVSVAASIGGIIVWREAQGFAGLTEARGATVDTPYAIGSVSKALTASVVMRLADQGRIDLDKDIRVYVPGFPVKSHIVTTRQLLSHQAGIRHYRFELSPPMFSEFGSTVQYGSVRESLSVFDSDPLLFEPDTAFSYSTFGYTLLSAVVEGAAGRPFLEVMQNELFLPVGMTASGGDDKLRPAAGRASDYQSVGRDEHVLAAPETNSSGKWAGGGMRATPTDLVRFGSALLDGRIVSLQSRELMFTPRKLKNGKVNPQNYGLGFRIDMISDPAYPGKSWRAVHHGGVAAGSQAMLVLLPEQNVVVAITANATTQPPGLGMFDAATDLGLMIANR